MEGMGLKLIPVVVRRLLRPLDMFGHMASTNTNINIVPSMLITNYKCVQLSGRP